jgi:probable rRNA maturation factor
MDELVDTICEDPRWNAADLDTLAAQAAQATLSHLGFGADGFEIALLGCDDSRIAVLNTEFRDKETPTNVLSWPSDERAASTPGGAPLRPEPGTVMAEELGDIAISYDTCAREADAAGKPFKAHVTHLMVHGVLHLLGYDHICEEDAALMEGLEVEILATLGLSDPYS